MSDYPVTSFYRADGVRIDVGPVFGRKRQALSVGRDGQTSVRVLGYFRSDEAADDFREAMRELLNPRLTKVGEVDD
jgi:hypothetical protein